MKKVKLVLASAAILLGTSFGFANSGNYVADTVYYNCTGSNPGWRSIPAEFEVVCDENPDVDCKGTGTLTNPQPTGDKGCGRLVPITPLH